MNRRPNPLIGWQVDPTTLRTIGHDLSRPECILAEPDGSLWTADGRGGVMHIRPDGNQQLVIPTANCLPATGSFPTASSLPDGSSTTGRNLADGSLPNGLAFARNGDLLIANWGTDVLEVMTRDGRRRAVYDNIDGMPLGKVNFVLRDSRDRIWITVSTRTNPWSDAICSRLADGYIAVLDEGGLRVAADGSLHDREVYGPSSLGSGAIDGIAFDAYGNLWAAMICADKLVAITPDGDLLTLFDDGDHEAAARFDAELDSGRVVSVATMAATGGKIAPWLTSLTFGGPDLRTVYLGSVKGNTIPYFNSPVAGLPMAHWGS